MKAAFVFPARRADAARLAPTLGKTGTLRPGLSAEEGLALTYLSSDATFSILDAEHHVIGMFGVFPGSLEGTGALWMVASDAIKKPAITIRILKECRRWMDHLHSFYPLLGSTIQADNKVHIKWLNWLGFSLRGESTIANELFLEFVKLASEDTATHNAAGKSFPKVPPKPKQLPRGKAAAALRGRRAAYNFSSRTQSLAMSYTGQCK